MKQKVSTRNYLYDHVIPHLNLTVGDVGSSRDLVEHVEFVDPVSFPKLVDASTQYVQPRSKERHFRSKSTQCELIGAHDTSVSTHVEVVMDCSSDNDLMTAQPDGKLINGIQ